MKNRKNKRHFHKSKFEGNIRINRRGIGFVEEPFNKQTVEIEPDFTGVALDGDLVEVGMHAKRGDTMTGEVLKVLERAKTRFVGVLDKKEKGDTCFVIPDNRRIHIDILIPNQEIKRLGNRCKNGQKVLVEIEPWTDSRQNPIGKIIDVIGQKGTHETEIKSILYESGFVYDFSEGAKKEAEQAEKNFSKTLKQEVKNRRDMRGITTFTIDPETAKDFDDALSYQENSDGTSEVGVHIADVAFYVREDTALDKDARDKATSVYMVDRTIPMLPPELSENICSLRPEEERLAFSTVFTLDKEGNILKTWLGRTIILSDKRFTYKEAQEVIDGKITDKRARFQKPLLVMRKYADKFFADRVANGSVLFEREEVEIKLGKGGKPLSITPKPKYATQNLIEEWMLMANKAVAVHMSEATKKKRAAGFVYRIHDKPNGEKIADLSIYLKGLGFDLTHPNENITGKDLNKLFKKIEGGELEHIIKFSVLRSMSKAEYSTKNIGHFGLAFKDYSHFTSPIRRYPDVMAHRMLDLELNKKKTAPQYIEWVQKQSEHSSKKEREAEKAERESVKYKQIQYMADHVGKTFEGIITGVVDWGLYVEETSTQTDGLVKLNSLKDDFYELDDKKFEIVGVKNKNRYHLGQKVKIEVLNADPEERIVDYKIVK